MHIYVGNAYFRVIFTKFGPGIAMIKLFKVKSTMLTFSDVIFDERGLRMQISRYLIFMSRCADAPCAKYRNEEFIYK